MVDSLKEALLEIERRKHEDPVGLVYKPHSFQEKIHGSRTPVTLVLGGNRTGKSYSAVAESIMYAEGRSKYAETPDPPVVVWYVMPSLRTFRRGIWPIFNMMLPWNRVKKHDKSNHIIVFENGSEIHFMSADMRQRRLAGAAVDLVIIDEPISKVVFDELQARTISTRGRILMVLTPVDEDQSKWTWIRDELYMPAVNRQRPDISVIHMPVADENGKPLVPHLTVEDIRKIERMYPDPNVRAARMYGEFVSRSGLVFSTFDPSIHLIDRFEVPEGFHQWLVVDPQYHRFACLFFCADDQGNYYVTREYYSADETYAVRAQRIGAMLGPMDRELPMYVDSADPQAVAEMNHHFRKYGVPIGAMPLPIAKKVDKMVLRVHSMLEPSEDRKYHRVTGKRNLYGAPRLMIFNDITSTWKYRDQVMRESRLLWEMNRLSWDHKGRPDKDSAEGADCSDCLIYGCSIVASGTSRDIMENWKDRLPARDVVVYEAIERMDHKPGARWSGYTEY